MILQEKTVLSAEGRHAQTPPPQPCSLWRGKPFNVYQNTLSLLEDDSNIPDIKLIDSIKRVSTSGVGNMPLFLPRALRRCQAQTVWNFNFDHKIDFVAQVQGILNLSKDTNLIIA